MKRSGVVIECGRFTRAYDDATCGADAKVEVKVKVENEEVGKEMMEDEQVRICDSICVYLLYFNFSIDPSQHVWLFARTSRAT